MTRIFVLACGMIVIATAAPAQAQAQGFDIPPTSLQRALEMFTHQRRVQLSYRTADLRGVSSPGIQGTSSTQAALTALLAGTGFSIHRDQTGAFSIMCERGGQCGASVRPVNDLVASYAQVQSPLAAASASAPAAETSADQGGPDTIIVTARRREENLQRVPLAVSVLSGRDIERRGVNDTSQLTTSVPGVFSLPASVRGSETPAFQIRGLLNRDPSLTSDPSVGIYFAEVPLARPEGTNAAFFDLQSVQVLKGPQGTLFGRNATGGAILITPQAPTHNLEGFGKITIGDYGLAEAQGAINVPLGDMFAVRVAGSHRERNGFTRNVTADRRTNDVDNDSLRVSASLSASAFTSVFIGTYYDSRTNGDGARLIRVAPAAPSAGVASFYPRLVDALARTAALRKYEYLNALSPGVPNTLTTDQFLRVRTRSIQNTSTLDLGDVGVFGDVMLRNIISYRKLKSAVSTDALAVDFLTNENIITQDSKQVSEEFQMQGKTERLSYILGLFYFREHGRDQTTVFNFTPTASVFDGRVVNRSFSLFANVDYKLLPDLSLSGGIRLNNDRRHLDNHNRRQFGSGLVANPQFTCFFPATASVNDGSLCGFAQSASFHEPTWNATVSYRPFQNSLLYGTFSRGYRTGGFNEFATAPATAVPFLPEKVDSYELGLKSEASLAGMPVRFNLAAYYMSYSNIQRQLNVLGANNVLVLKIVNAAKANIRGLESELTIKPSSRLELTASYAFTRPRYGSFTDNFLEPRNGVTYPIDVSDSRFIVVSKHSLAASGRYSLPLNPSYGDLAFFATYYYRSSFFNGGDINTANCIVPGDPLPNAIYSNCYSRNSKLPGYGIVNARIDWSNIFNSGIDASMFVNNVTNKYYYNNAIVTLSSIGGLIGNFGAPRMFGASLTKRFGS